MANKELRSMNRTELIEIIYALQQEEHALRAENEQLRRQLEDKTLRMEKAGSIAEAALSLNHIFEDAEAAARQYLDSLKAMTEEAEAQARKAREQTEPPPGPVDLMELIQQLERECPPKQAKKEQNTE